MAPDFDAATMTEPAASEPAAVEAAAAEPAATEPAATEPAATEPAATEPAATEPAATEPVDSIAGAASRDALRRAVEAIWVAAQKFAWSSLALVPAVPTLELDVLARAIAEVGAVHLGEPVEALDLRGATLASSRATAETLADESKPYRRVVALACPVDDLAAQLLAAAATGAVLVLEKDVTRVAEARRVMQIVGPERFVGAVVLEPRP